MTEEPVGTVLAGYRLEAVIGRGGMSAVYRAEHVHLGKKVALKILSPALALDEDFRERFLRESRTAASIEHPNIIPIYDAGEVDGRLYIAMRHVDGLDLKQLIERDGPLSLGRTVFFIEQIASALDTAHALGLVHRDVKPGNVLVATGTERVFLTDFGVVKHSGSTGLTRTGYFLGTIDYAAPEQIEGRPVDGRTDVYAVGCLVYECLTGAPPFQRAGEMAVIHAHLTEDPPRPSLKRPELPPMIDAVVAKAMAKEQAQRYPSAGALAQALRAVALDVVPDPTAAGERTPAPETVISKANVPKELSASPASPKPSAEPTPKSPMPASPPAEAVSVSTEARRTAGGPSRFRAGASPPGRWHLGKKAIIIAAAALLLAAAAATALAMRGGGGGSNKQTPMSESAMNAGAYPDAIEQDLLLAHIPIAIRSTCRRIEPIATAVFLRSIRCRQGGGQPGFVTYSRAHSGDALRAYFLQQLQNVGLQYPTRSACRAKQAAADEWRREGLTTHIEEPSRGAEGRVLCYRDRSTAWVVWTDTPTKILARAARPTMQWSSLYTWWRNSAGPEKDLGMEQSMGAPNGRYPDAIEQQLLLHHIPPSVRKTCARSNAFEHTVFLRAVKCSPGIRGTSVEYMYAHNGSALKIYSANEISAAGLNFPTSSKCATATEAADTWIRSDDIAHIERHFTRQAGGRVLCYAAAGRAVIEWTDSRTGIYARATGAATIRRILYGWWKGGAGPGALEMGAMESGSTG